MVEHKDRAVWLTVFGIVELLLAGMCLLGLLFAGLSMALSAGEMGMPVTYMIPGLFFYLAAAVFWAWMGVGSILARRWARALMLATSWLWLIFGIITVLFLCVMLPRMFSQIAGQHAEPAMAGVMMFTMVFSALFYGVFLVAMPLVFLLFYRGANVKATCEARDPEPRWTDGCPLPVLALSVMFAWGALSCLVSAPISIIPFFGQYLTGPPGMIIMLMVGAVFAWLAYGTSRMMPVAWWVSIGLICAATVSGTITSARVDLLEVMVATMSFPEEALASLEMIDFSKWMMWQSAIYGTGMVIFLLYLKRYFRPSTHGTSRTVM